MLTIGSLFSGVGGLELGLEMSGLGPTIWQVEKDPQARHVLEHHWPEVAKFDDVCTVGANELVRVDLICGGFPCEDVSGAGKRAGLTGRSSGLWSEFARIVRELSPSFVVVENVTSGATRWVDTVVRDLENEHYHCLPIPLSARDVGAPHLRRRVFIVAADADRFAERLQSRGRRGSHGPGETIAANDGAMQPVADSDGKPQRKPHHQATSKRAGWARSRAHAVGGSWWQSEPDVGRVADGTPYRLDRLRLLGKAVVPQCAEVVGWVVRELAGPELASEAR